MSSSQPTLAAPGEGLPQPEAWISRNIVFPLVKRLLKPQAAVELVGQVGNDLVARFETLSEEAQTKPVLIARLRGLEDSSRFWSPLMVIEHLQITGTAMQAMATELATGVKPTVVVRTQDVKPTLETTKEIVVAYKHWLDQYPSAIAQLFSLPPTALTKLTHPHPWFGELNANQWIQLNSMHHRLHKDQFNAILSA